MKGNCQVNDVVSKCDVTRPLPKKVYLGLAREKCILDLQWENGRYVSTTTSYHHTQIFRRNASCAYMKNWK